VNAERVECREPAEKAERGDEGVKGDGVAAGHGIEELERVGDSRGGPMEEVESGGVVDCGADSQGVF
jgi:hypothetical protein